MIKFLISLQTKSTVCVAFRVAMVFMVYAIVVPTVQALDFVVADGEVVTEQYNLFENETLLVESGGVLTSLEGQLLGFGGTQMNIGYASIRGNNVTVVNYGVIGEHRILAAEYSDYGISMALDISNATVINHGVIITVSDGGHGMGTSDGAENAKFVNSGTIETFGAGGVGIFSLDGSHITNSGTIATQGSRGRGIQLGGTGDLATNSGKITGQGDGAMGIWAIGEKASVIHSGTVKVTGDNAYGILLSGDKTSLTISGNIFAFEGENSFAIHGDISGSIYGQDVFWAGSQTLNILSGTEILGRINLGAGGADNDVANVMTNSRMASMTLVLEDTETINLLTGDIPALLNGETVVILDPTGAAGDRALLGATTNQIHRLVLQQLADKEEGWLRIFANSSDRDNDGLANAWDQSISGVVGGYDTVLTSGQRVGLFVGYSHGQIETSDVASINNTADNLFFGAYGQHVMDKLTFSGSVVVGFADHDSERTLLDNLEGFEHAEGDYSSFYISPSLAVGMSHDLGDGVQLRPSAQMAYTYSSFGSYTESGTTRSDVSFDGRNVNILDGRLQLAVARTFFEDRAEVELRTGGTLTLYGEDSVDVSLADDSVSYKVPGETTISGGYTGVSVRHAFSDRINLAGDFEYGWAGPTTQSLSGHLGLVYKF